MNKIFNWVKSWFKSKDTTNVVIPAEVPDEPLIDIKPEIVKPKLNPKPIVEGISYCSTHGCPLDSNRYCEKCVEIAKKHGLYCNDPLNNDMDKDGRHGNHFDSRVNDPQKKLLGEEDYSKCPNLVRFGYFCDNCEIVLYHQLQHCPRCGTKFVYRKMSYKDMCESFPQYRVGY